MYLIVENENGMIDFKIAMVLTLILLFPFNLMNILLYNLMVLDIINSFLIVLMSNL